MNAEILCVGTELLLGDVVNTNAAEVAKELASLGINVYHHEVVGDNPERLKESLALSFKRADLVVLTGGLGPTYDDLTKETVAAYFGRKLVMDEEYSEVLKSFFNKTGRKMTDNNIKQAMMPEGCVVLANPNGTAPGCAIEGDGKIAVMMPGPPREMLPMLQGPVRDFLKSKSDCVLTSEVLNVYGIGESSIEAELKDIMVNYENPTLAPYAKTGECQLRITAKAKTKEEGLKLIEPVKKEILKRFPNGEVYGENYESLFEAIVDKLSKNGQTLACAESLTGGLISSRIVDHPGASKVLMGSAVVYSNEAKNRVLGVNEETLKNYGAVSKECAIEMAENARKIMSADIGLSTTGIAGPDGGTDKKPVGLVYIAVASDKGTKVKELHLARGRKDDREMIRNSSCCNGAFMVLKASDELKGI